MKLIFCDMCWDVFKLDYDLRSCKCGNCKGMYDDNGATAVTNGKGCSIAISNGSLQNALMGEAQYEYKSTHHGYDIPLTTFLAWVRPHEGDQNPRSRVDPDLGKDTVLVTLPLD